MRFFFVLIVLIVAGADSSCGSEEAKQTNARTRFIIGLDREAKYSFITLPTRVIVVLPDVRMQLPPKPASSMGLVTGFTGGLAGPGRARVVIDVAQSVTVENARIEPAGDKAWRLSFDMVPTESATKPETKAQLPRPGALSAAGIQPPRPQVSRRTAQAQSFRPTIVIDPGWGGDRLGPVANGIVAKDVLLAISKLLEQKLQATGRYHVFMTRDSDVSVPLDERRRLAETQGAHLFISLHVGSAVPAVRGAAVYTLTAATFDKLQLQAKRDVADVSLPDSLESVLEKSGEDARAIASVLADLAAREIDHVDNSSTTFRQHVLHQLQSVTPLRDNPELSADFRVLLTAKVPSVLIEVAQVSNPDDANRLGSPEWKDQISNALLTAIEIHFVNQLARINP